MRDNAHVSIYCLRSPNCELQNKTIPCTVLEIQINETMAMTMIIKSMLAGMLACVLGQAHAICVKNETDFNLYYEIYNLNTGCPVPKVKFHSGILHGQQTKCHAHSPNDGDDWKIYRHDLIKIFKINKNNERVRACEKNVMGILNTLEVNYHDWSDTWWCLDDSDDED